MEFVDTHAHIYAKEFKDDLDGVINRSLEAGVNKIYMPNVDHTSIDAMLEVEHKYPEHCIATMGLHPCHVDKNFEKELYIVEEWLNKRKFVAVGEIGVDLYWDKTHQEQQLEAFRIQIGLAKKFDIPIVIHCRDAFEETMSIVEELKDEKLRGIFHCFTGTVEEAQRILASGFHIGLGGVSTFKNAKMDQVIPEIDLSRIVLETDSPYLAPVPFRGKRNEPSYIPHIAQRIADCQQISLEQVAEVTTANAKTIYG
jgi:TatD DNase family protein